MITHVVLLQPKHEVTDNEITVALNHVRALQDAIPGIIEIQVGKNMSTYNQGYTHGFVMRFVDAEHLKAHQESRGDDEQEVADEVAEPDRP